MKKTILHAAIIMAASVCISSCTGSPSLSHGDPDEKVLIAYVYTPDEMPDPTYLTHINYAFGHVNDSFDGAWIENPAKLQGIVALKEQYSHLKVLLSIGGWGSGNFSEMAADSTLRWKFCLDCRRIADEYGLDGIDIDWEYPTSKAAGISASEEDTDNYTLLMRDLRTALGNDLLLTHAVASTAEYMDYKAVDNYVNFTNVMTYDMGWPPYHNAPLYPSENGPGRLTVSESIQRFLDLGIAPGKLVLGMPFYGHGVEGFHRPHDLTKAHLTEGCTFHWDEDACVPYLTDNETGEYVFGYEDLKSLTLKAEYALSKNLLGAMYWAYDGDNEAGDLRRTVYMTLNPGKGK